MKKKLFIIFILVNIIFLNFNHINGMSYIKNAWNGVISATRKGWNWIKGETELDETKKHQKEDQFKITTFQDHNNKNIQNKIDFKNIIKSDTNQTFNQDIPKKIDPSKATISNPQILNRLLSKLQQDIKKKTQILKKKGTINNDEELKNIKKSIQKDINYLKKIYKIQKKNDTLTGSDRDSFYQFIKNSFTNQKKFNSNGFKRSNRYIKNKKDTLQNNDDHEKKYIFESEPFKNQSIQKNIEQINTNNDSYEIDQKKINALILPHHNHMSMSRTKNFIKKYFELKKIEPKIYNKQKNQQVQNQPIINHKINNNDIPQPTSKSKRIAYLSLPKKNIIL